MPKYNVCGNNKQFISLDCLQLATMNCMVNGYLFQFLGNILRLFRILYKYINIKETLQQATTESLIFFPSANVCIIGGLISTVSYFILY